VLLSKSTAAGPDPAAFKDGQGNVEALVRFSAEPETDRVGALGGRLLRRTREKSSARCCRQVACGTNGELLLNDAGRARRDEPKPPEIARVGSRGTRAAFSPAIEDSASARDRLRKMPGGEAARSDCCGGRQWKRAKSLCTQSCAIAEE